MLPFAAFEAGDKLHRLERVLNRVEGGGVGAHALQDVAVHLQNPEARRFYEKAGFVALNEERLSCLI